MSIRTLADVDEKPSANGNWKRTAIVFTLVLLPAFAHWGWQIYSTPGIPVVNYTAASPVVERVIEKALNAVKQEPKSAEAWGHLGSTLLAHDFAVEANYSFEQAARFAPDNPRWPYLRSFVAENAGKRIEYVEQAMELSPQEPMAFTRLGEIYLASDQLDEARPLFEKAIEINAEHAQAHAGLGRIAHAQGNLDEARDHLDQAVKAAPWMLSSRSLLARVHFQLGNHDAARQQQQLMATQSNTGSWDDPYLDQALDLGVSVERLVARADALRDRGKNVQANLKLEQAIEYYPEFSGAHVALGMALIKDRNGVEAERVMQRALELAPDELGPNYGLASAFALQGKLEQAVDFYRNAIKIQPQFASAHFDLGQCLEKLGQTDEANQAFQKAITLNPAFSAIREKLAPIKE